MSPAKEVCVDASLAVKVVVTEPDSDKADALFDEWATDGKQLIAPAFQDEVFARQLTLREKQTTIIVNATGRRKGGRGMPNGTLERFRHAIANTISRLTLIVKQKLFRWRWGVDLTLPPQLCQCVKEVAGSNECEVLPWQVDWIQRLEQALFRLPRELVDAAGVRHVFVAENLRDRGAPRLGVAYELRAVPEPKWVGVDVSLFRREEEEPYLQIPLHIAVVAEEFIHVWDYRLEATRSPYSSASDDWKTVERDELFDPANVRLYDRIAENWALAVLWYLFQREELQRRWPEHYAFAARLFRECLQL